jgi:hypothetical protein
MFRFPRFTSFAVTQVTPFVPPLPANVYTDFPLLLMYLTRTLTSGVTGLGMLWGVVGGCGVSPVSLLS